MLTLMNTIHKQNLSVIESSLVIQSRIRYGDEVGVYETFS